MILTIFYTCSTTLVITSRALIIWTCNDYTYIIYIIIIILVFVCTLKHIGPSCRLQV